MNNIKICVVGIGKHSFFNLIPSLERTKNFQIVALVSKNPKTITRRYKRYTNINVAIKKLPKDTLYVLSTPPSSHFHLIMTILKKHRNVLVEKPLVNNREQIDKIFKLNLGKQNFFYEMFMYNYTMCFLKTINYCKENFDNIEKIEFNFLLPSYPQNTFRDSNLLEDSCLYDVGSYIFNYCINLGNKIKNLKLLNYSFNKKKLEKISFFFEVSGLEVISKIGLNPKYKNNMKIINKDKTYIIFDKIFYGKKTKKYIKSSEKNNEISFCDNNGFDFMFHKLNFKKIVKNKLLNYIKLKEIYKQIDALQKEIEKF